MAIVRKRTRVTKDGKEKTAWLVDYRDQEGKRRFQTYARKRDADAALAEIQGEVRRGEHTPKSTSITVAEAAAIWVKRGELDELERSTLDQYRDHVRLHIVPLIGNVKLAKLSKPAVHAFKDELLGKGSRAMARKILVSLRSIIIEAQNRGLVGQNVAKDVKVDTKNREKPKLRVGRDIPSKAEVQEILSKAVDPDFPSFARWRPLLVTAMFTGMRSSELRGLTWDAVDIDRKVIHVHQRADAWGTMGPPKSEAGEREIPMSPMVVNALREWQLACPKGELGLVFPNGAGNVQAHSNIVARGWYAIQEKAGIVGPTGRHKYGFHSLRHFFASCAIEQEFSAKRLQALLGHSSITMTFDTYGHLFPSEEDDQAKFAAAEASVMRVV